MNTSKYITAGPKWYLSILGPGIGHCCARTLRPRNYRRPERWDVARRSRRRWPRWAWRSGAAWQWTTCTRRGGGSSRRRGRWGIRSWNWRSVRLGRNLGEDLRLFDEKFLGDLVLGAERGVFVVVAEAQGFHTCEKLLLLLLSEPKLKKHSNLKLPLKSGPRFRLSVCRLCQFLLDT